MGLLGHNILKDTRKHKMLEAALFQSMADAFVYRVVKDDEESRALI